MKALFGAFSVFLQLHLLSRLSELKERVATRLTQELVAVLFKYGKAIGLPDITGEMLNDDAIRLLLWRYRFRDKAKLRGPHSLQYLPSSRGLPQDRLH